MIVSDEQFVSYYGIRHVISHETKIISYTFFAEKCIHRVKYIPLNVDFYSRLLLCMYNS